MPQSWPTDIYPTRCNFYLQHNTRAFVSPITRSRQSLRGQGERWRCDVSFRLIRADARRLDGLLAKLKGAYDSISLGDFDREHPGGVNRQSTSSPATFFTDGTGFTDGTHFEGGHAVRVFGSNAIGSETLVTEGWYGVTPGQLLAGDYVEAGGWLYMLTDDAASDSSGMATLSIAPPLRSTLADGAALTIDRPRTLMQLVDDDQPARQISVDAPYEYSLSFVQAL